MLTIFAPFIRSVKVEFSERKLAPLGRLTAELFRPSLELLSASLATRRGIARILQARVLIAQAVRVGSASVSRLGQTSPLLTPSNAQDTAELARTTVGSPCYLSPEIVQGASYSYKSDVWSLGVTLYRMATNKFPFDAANLAQLALKITAGSFPPLSPKYSPQAHHLTGHAD